MANFRTTGTLGVRDYVLGTHRDELAELPTDAKELLDALYSESATIKLKRMSQAQKDEYADAVAASAGRRLLTTIRREVGKFIASPGDNTVDGQPFRDVKHFVKVMPVAVMLDISAELQATSGVEVGEGSDG